MAESEKHGENKEQGSIGAGSMNTTVFPPFQKSEDVPMPFNGFTTAIVISAGYCLDPTSLLMNAKQISYNLTRNVLIEFDIGNKTKIIYSISPNEKTMVAEIVDVRTTTNL